MFSTFRNAWKVPELRKKILYTLLIILIFRIGCHVPVPFMDPNAVSSMFAEGNFLSYMDILSGGALSQGTLFSLSIQPYINASIIVQLLTYALPPLENLQKEGESGRKKLQKITGFVSLGIALIMAYAYYMTLRNSGALTYTAGFQGIFTGAVIISALIAGSSLVIWLGNRINERGIGNGVSILLFAGIVSRGPSAILSMMELVKSETKYILIVPVVLLVFIFMIGFIVFMNESERRIPIQYAKRVVGRKQYGGQNTHIPIKIAMSGVMPIIFAMAIMSLPSTLSMFIHPAANPETFWQKFYVGFLNFFSYNSPWYAILYFLLIIAFNYFYVSMQYNPIEIANNLRQNNGGIPGIRPGKPTSDFIQRVLGKITLVGAFFLGVIAIFPILTNLAFPQLGIAMGGTSILIVVSVVLETVRTLESQMMMRHHKGFLE
ncbi:MAG: preprotein translocase subunit SecY [Oscillospiraceae bacterium]|nr:preprotein translocase subunit SecY [Oscillospiraceae bacterium]